MPISPSPSARARPCGGLAHTFHDRSLRRIHALPDAVARAADQRECKGYDRQGAQLLISRLATIQARPAVEGKGERAEAPPKEDRFLAQIQWLPATELTVFASSPLPSCSSGCRYSRASEGIAFQELPSA